MLDLGVADAVWPWIWLFIAVGFALIEITLLGGSFILLPFAVSAFLASILGFYDAPIEAQWGVFVLGGGFLWIGFYRWAKTFLSDHELPPGVGAERLVGLVGIVTAAVDPRDADRRGRITVAGESWGAVSVGEAPIAEGTQVQVVSMQGTRVVVQPFEPDDIDEEIP